MNKLVTHVCLTRFGLRRWENKVNALLDEGWMLSGMSVEKSFFKIVCWAWLSKEPAPAAEVAAEAVDG